MLISPKMAVVRPAQQGFTLVELMITITVLGILLMVGLPNMTLMLKNGQVRTAADSALAGLQFARNEAIRTNTPTRFQLVTDLTSACTLSSSGTSWVVSRASAAGACNAAPERPDISTPANAAWILQKRDGAEGTPKATVAGLDSASTPAAANTVVFNGVGRVSGSGLARLDFGHISDACESASTPGAIRCLRIMISTGGTMKMCDPKVSDTTDPRYCAL